jgi:predicted NAD/FAD-binding protein
MNHASLGQRQIAVVGAGVAGLTAAYLLQRGSDVTLYEAQDRLGGHAHTHDVAVPGHALAVDSGFIVYNERTYPMLCRLFRELCVRTRPSEMSMSVRCDGCGLAYAGARGVAGLIAQPTSLIRPSYLAMLAQIPAFYRQAQGLLASTTDGQDAASPGPTLGQFLAAGRYSTYFVRHFAVPLVSAVWSCGPELVTEYPARYLFTFLAQHGMLHVRRSVSWRTVEGGSRSYVEAVAKDLHAIRTSAPVRSVRRHGRGVAIRDESDTVREFDGVIIATHADQALRLLAVPDFAQRTILGAFCYSRNETVLHTDGSALPARRAARSSWNYVQPSCAPSRRPVQISYDMNRLQGLGAPSPVIVTLNGNGRIRADRVLATMVYEHPIYTRAAVAAQAGLPSLNDGVLAFAGSYHGWGFHEDGCRSGVAAARSLGATW